MISDSLLQSIIKKIYGLRVQSILSLQYYTHEWRGIFRVITHTGESWVLRIQNLPESLTIFNHTASILTWLQQHQFPVPTVHVTKLESSVGIYDNWYTMLLSYIDGDIIPPQPMALLHLGALLAQLHSVPITSASQFRQARTHIAYLVSTTNAQYATYQHRIPKCYRPLAERLFADIAEMQHMQQNLSITHGDCWYFNAIETPEKTVRLIDWDYAGIGTRLFDIGNLLLTTHYDYKQPLVVNPDKQNIRAIINGYKSYATITEEQRA